MMSYRTPLFITFEGGEGSGKSTLIDRLECELTKQGFQVVKTREPGGTKLGEQIRFWLLNRNPDIKIEKKAELLLFLAARVQHLEEIIKPALAAGKIVICDRFHDSTIVYQGIARGIGQNFVQQLCDLVCDHLVPNLTFFLDVAPEVGLERSKGVEKKTAKAGEMDRIEGEDFLFHQKIREGFLLLTKQNPQRIYRIDAHQSADAVFTDVIEKILGLAIKR